MAGYQFLGLPVTSYGYHFLGSFTFWADFQWGVLGDAVDINGLGCGPAVLGVGW